MPLNIKHPEAEQLARELAARTGESLTDAVLIAVRERLERENRKKRTGIGAAAILRETRLRLAASPVLDPRSPEEILGYDERGLPH
jgi:antitoxin VapB